MSGSRGTEEALPRIFRLQRELASMMGPRYPDDTDGRVSALCSAIIHEAVELQRLTSWKWWKSPEPLDRAAAREELVDIWHFVVQASIELGMEPSDILAEYERKHAINVGRQRDGY